jgi:copper ion binding protein
METKTFVVPAISCGHCVHTVETEVSEIEGVRSVEADEQTKQVKVEWDNPATWAQIEKVLTEIDYPPAK